MYNDEASSSSSTSNPNATRRVSRVGIRLRNPRGRLGMARRRLRERQAEALALPQGVSIAAAFANLVRPIPKLYLSLYIYISLHHMALLIP